MRGEISEPHITVVRHSRGHKLVMPGLVPGIHVLRAVGKAWMAGTSPAITLWGIARELTKTKCDRPALPPRPLN
ncbi:hypothetical protein ABMB68_009704 [Bradyrhizobium sp. RT4a]